jgi:hypothetical protein
MILQIVDNHAVLLFIWHLFNFNHGILLSYEGLKPAFIYLIAVFFLKSSYHRGRGCQSQSEIMRIIFFVIIA